MKKLQIFKPGRHTAMSGAVLEFSDAELSASAQGYDPTLREAPLVVGHPTIDAPAYGWVKSLEYVDGRLYAIPDQVDAAFAELVNAGRYKKISASFYTPQAANNPKPGTYYLRHVGFLGAQAPAVAGLKSASFAGGNDGVIEFAADIDTQSAIKWLKAAIKLHEDHMAGRAPTTGADGDKSQQKMMNQMQRALAALTEGDDSKDDAKMDMAEPLSHSQEHAMTLTAQKIADQEAALKKEREDIDRQRAEFAERENAIKAAETKAKRDGVSTFVAGLVKDGKVLPRDQVPLVEFMAAVDDAAVIEFAEGAEKKTTPRGEWLREFLGRLPTQVDYAEHTKPTDSTAAAVSFAAPHGYAVDAARLELHQKALAYQGAHPNTSYDAALAAVS